MSQLILILLSVGLILFLSTIALFVYSLVQYNKFQKNMYQDIKKVKSDIADLSKTFSDTLGQVNNSIDEIKKDYAERIGTCIDGQKSLEKDIANQSKNLSDTLEELSDSVDDYNEEVTRKIELIKNSIQELANKQKNNSIPQIYALLAGMEEVEQQEDMIFDKETTYTLTNIYKKSVLVSSIITNLKGKVIYEIKYDSNGEIETSISYDEKGNKQVQQFFKEGKLIKRQTFHGDKIDLHTFS